MKKETLFHLIPSRASSEMIAELLSQKESGNHLGFTFPDGNTHTCFNGDQEDRFIRILNSYLERGLEYEKASYYRGNLSGGSFGIATFGQPLVGWCPDPIISARTLKVFDKQEPWGLTTNRLVALPVSMFDLIRGDILGLQFVGTDFSQEFGLYRIVGAKLSVPAEIDYSIQPLIVDAGVSVPDRDIWWTENDAIVCSSRFAKVLSDLWEGLPDVKFQPIECRNFAKPAADNLKKRFSPRGDYVNALRDVRVIESALVIRFPSRYVHFLQMRHPHLPHGWLSVSGGLNSALLRIMADEQTKADPAMPRDLIPIFAYGNGDYVCYRKLGDSQAELELVDWLHESGTVQPHSGADPLDELLKTQE